MKISMLLTLFPLLMPASVLAGTAQYTDLGAVMALTLTQNPAPFRNRIPA